MKNIHSISSQTSQGDNNVHKYKQRKLNITYEIVISLSKANHTANHNEVELGSTNIPYSFVYNTTRNKAQPPNMWNRELMGILSPVKM